jgi:pentatricopeptide repeat protein
MLSSKQFFQDLWSDPSRLFAELLRSCIAVRSLPCARQLHAVVLTSGLSPDRFVSNHLLNLYTKLGQIRTAAHLFDAMPRKNVMSYNIMVGGYVQNEDLGSARKLFYEMPVRNAASWSAVLAGAVNFGFNEEGLGLFCEMRRGGFCPDEFTLGSVLRGCAGLRDVVSGRLIHADVVRRGFEADVCVGSSLAHMYMNCGCLKDGERVVDALPMLTVVSCNTIVAGRVQNGDPEGALRFFHVMKLEGLSPDQITFTSALAACSELATLGQGQQIHAQVLKTGVDSVLAVRSSLVSMYSKCGCLSYATTVFSQSSSIDFVLWSAMIAAYGFHGHGQEAIELFERMVALGTDPNEVTFLSLLYACSHSGLKEKGKDVFKLMTDVYMLAPQLEHYTCMVDLIGRSGCLEEAEDLIKSMPMNPDAIIWKTLLSSCKIHKNFKMAERIVECIIRLDPHDSAAHVLLSQVHATSGRWQEVAQVRKHMKYKKVKKEPGMSWVEVKNKVHQFSMGDISHPEYREIHNLSREMAAKMKQHGYMPDITAVLHDMEDEEKEFSLFVHSERLAVAFAILHSPEGAMIRVMKNLRVCNDCHAAIKLISKITQREIVVRDVSRFHHFRGGDCSCGDYW